MDVLLTSIGSSSFAAWLITFYSSDILSVVASDALRIAGRNALSEATILKTPSLG